MRHATSCRATCLLDMVHRMLIARAITNEASRRAVAPVTSPAYAQLRVVRLLSPIEIIGSARTARARELIHVHGRCDGGARQIWASHACSQTNDRNWIVATHAWQLMFMGAHRRTQMYMIEF